MDTMSNINSPVLELLDLGKSIKGKQIVKNLRLSLQPSEVFGFLGPNGAGKTTTIRMIVGLIKPTEGQVKICGYSVTNDFISAMSNVGCIIESPDLYKFMTGIENLLQFAAMDGDVTKSRIEEVIGLVGLRHRIHDKVSTYSLGMRQRLGIAQAILSKPKLLILDEPTNGLDPGGITEFRNLIKKFAHEDGMTVFVSSHLLSEVQLLCDRVAIIRQGTIVKVTEVAQIINTEIIEWILSDTVKAKEILRNKWNIEAVSHDPNGIIAPVGNASLEEINRSLTDNGIYLTYCCVRENTLEDLFLELTEGDEIV